MQNIEPSQNATKKENIYLATDNRQIVVASRNINKIVDFNQKLLSI